MFILAIFGLVAIPLTSALICVSAVYVARTVFGSFGPIVQFGILLFVLGLWSLVIVIPTYFPGIESKFFDHDDIVALGFFWFFAYFPAFIVAVPLTIGAWYVKIDKAKRSSTPSTS